MSLVRILRRGFDRWREGPQLRDSLSTTLAQELRQALMVGELSPKELGMVQQGSGWVVPNVSNNRKAWELP